MKNIILNGYVSIILCFCILSVGCASKNITTNMSKATLENPLHIPLTKSVNKVYIISKNITRAKEGVDGLLLALLQSEHSMSLANNASQADYTIRLEVESFAKIGTVDTPMDASDVALPPLIGTTSGTQIGSSDESRGGASIGMLSANGEQEVWQMVVDVDVEDKEGETFTTRVTAQSQGTSMDANEAAEALENEVAWTIVRAFKKNN